MREQEIQRESDRESKRDLGKSARSREDTERARGRLQERARECEPRG